MPNDGVKRAIAKNGAHGRARRDDPNAQILFSVAPGMAMTWTRETDTHVLARADVEAWVAKTDLGLVPVPPQPQPQPAPPTPLPITTGGVDPRYVLGVSCLHSVDNARWALERGCRAVLLMDAPKAAEQLAAQYPDAVVLARWFHGDRKVNPTEVFNALQIGADSRVYYTGLNEGQAYGHGTAAEIRWRAKFDLELARLIRARAPRARYCAGTFSMGTPGITPQDDPTVAQAFAETYVQMANAGEFCLNYHTYEETLGAQTDQWFELRPQRAYDLRGLNQNVAWVSGECGLDLHGLGFVGQNVSQTGFAGWCDRWLGLCRQMLVRPTAITLYQFGDHPGWRSFDLRPYIGTLERYWRDAMNGKRW